MSLHNLHALLQESATGNHHNPVLANDGVSLAESAAALTCEFNHINRSLNESQSRYIEDFAELLTEAAQGKSVDIDALDEGFFGDLKDKIVAGYKRLIEMIKGILAKIQSMFDGMTKTGAQLVTKYKSKITTDRSKFDYEGFDWISDIGTAVSYTNPCDFMKSQTIDGFAMNNIFAATPTAYPIKGDNFEKLEARGNGEATEASKEAEKSLRDELKKLDAAAGMNEMKVAYAKSAVAGLELESYNRLSEALFKKFRGRSDKHTIKNLDKMSFETVCSILEKGKDFSAISKIYDDMKKTLEDSLKKVEDVIKAAENKREGSSTTAGQKAIADIQIAFLKKAVSMANDLDGVASQINNAALTAAKDKYEECRMIFTKLMSYKPEKKQNNSAVDLMDEAYMAANAEDFDLLVESAVALLQ